jgi:hypothetical protein
VFGQAGKKPAAAELNVGAQRALVGAADTDNGQSLARPQHRHRPDWRHGRWRRSRRWRRNRAALGSTYRRDGASAGARQLPRMVLQAL